MAVPNFSLRQLGYLVAVADAGSMTAAAETEHVSQAAISMGIHDLEKRLGLQLLTRRPGHGVSLTESGVSVLEDARRVLSASTDLLSRSRAPGADLRGELNLGCFATLTPLYVPPLLGQFAVEHPAVKVNVVEGSMGDLSRAMSNGTCELAITYEAGLSTGFAVEPIMALRPYALLPADHRLANADMITLTDLAEEPLVQYSFESPPGIEHKLREVGIEPRVVHSSPNIEVVRSLVARGVGWTPMAQRWPRDVSLEGLPLTCVPLGDLADQPRVVVAWPEHDQLSRRSIAVIKFVRQVAKNMQRSSDGPSDA
ncbi:LysR family transcriptional regulator [Nocardioides sp. GCM10030258]|uniref:LysR family transcriptional regulator n=1 Tax=unclassified Nocardioides TaxID=2615069 RepID=UPI0036123C34